METKTTVICYQHEIDKIIGIIYNRVVKEAYIRELADKYCDSITENVYDALVNYKVEITD